ncbi:MT-A70 family methyltransferase [Methanoregula sp.]|jgi:site-specific DNA-methyltransferase (adenine-specific)|uniref:MT-A70 family methyltransferase n=1 Tax=Methanoregula sp. TaxID=2052170 RepID=UPI003567ED74
MIPFPDKKYQVIYADPAWQYRNKNTGGHANTILGCAKSGAAQKYDVMSTEEICALPVPSISSRNCVLFLWATTPLLPDAFKVMDAWGFEYKTAIYWRKIMSLGMGFWFRGQVEVCLFGIKGNVPAFHCQHPNFLQTKAGPHSRKPKELFDIIGPCIEKMTPKIELFARQRIEGWDCWGNQIPDEEQKLLKTGVLI